MSISLLLWAALAAHAAPPPVPTSYVPYRFEPSEGWALRRAPNLGASRLEGRKLTLDFSAGADSVAIAPPDRVLLGRVGKIRIRLRGAAPGHPAHLYLRTHFMTFHKVGVAPFTEGEQMLLFDGPPGPGWQWMNGENDGRIHGPIRIGELRFDANGRRDRAEIELLSITVDGTAPPDRLCVLTASSLDNRFGAEVRCQSETPLTGELSWTFRDWSGTVLGRGNRAVTLPAHAAPLVTEVPAPTLAPGIKFLEAEFALAISGQEVPPAQAYWTAAQPPHTDSSLRPNSPFGMGVYLDRYQGADMDRAAAAARDAGVKWNRQGFSWSRIEPSRGKFDWSYYDNLVACAKRHGISLYALISGWAPWTKPYTDEGIADYLAFLKQLVAHYKADVHHWEIWNEPNIFFWQGPREMYATLLRRAYAAVKEVDPTAKVLGMSTAGIDYNFIARTMSLDAPFDILTIHPYRRVLNDQAFINELSIVSDLVKGRPVWITEFGWATFTPHNALTQDFAPFTQRAQAELLARAYLCTLASGVQPNTSWYDFRNDGEDPIYFEHQMGILYRDFRPKPAYWAYSTLARVIGNRKLAGKLPSPEGVFAYRFTGQGGTTIALWSPEADTSITLPLTGSRITQVNTIGEARELQPGPHRIDLRKGVPVYITEE